MADAMAHRGPEGEGILESLPDDRGRGIMLAIAACQFWT
jgi:hypothetical protein